MSKVTPSWNTEIGYGAVAFDGCVRIDPERRAALGIAAAEEERDVGRAQAKVTRRSTLLRRDGGPLGVPGGTVVLVDDGLASGITLETAVEAVRGDGAGRMIVAVPTGHAAAVNRMAGLVDEIHCANVRRGRAFAVADAYQAWSDLDDVAILEILDRFRTGSSSPA